jgi:hypothetical protein
MREERQQTFEPWRETVLSETARLAARVQKRAVSAPETWRESSMSCAEEYEEKETKFEWEMVGVNREERDRQLGFYRLNGNFRILSRPPRSQINFTHLSGQCVRPGTTASFRLYIRTRDARRNLSEKVRGSSNENRKTTIASRNMGEESNSNSHSIHILKWGVCGSKLKTRRFSDARRPVTAVARIT